MSPIDISVVVPLYNNASTIGRCLECLFAQDYPADRFEVIVVDNGSTDGSDQIAGLYPAKIIYETDKPTSYAARNRGILAARGEIVLFTDADCITSSSWVSSYARVFDSPNVVIAWGPIEECPEESLIAQLIAELFPVRNGEQFGDSNYTSVVGGNAAYRRRALLEFGMFNESLYTGGDIDLAWRVQKGTKSQAAFAREGVVFHDHRSSLLGLARRYRRYGYCSAIMTAMHKNEQEYSQSVRWQLRQILAQIFALLNYVRALAQKYLWLVIGRGKQHDVMRLSVLLVAEWSTIIGRLTGILDTRCFSRVPSFSNRRRI